VVAGSVQAPLPKKYAAAIFIWSAPAKSLSDQPDDQRHHRFTQIDHLTLLLDASDSTLAGELLAEYGSLKARGYFFCPMISPYALAIFALKDSWKRL
jgi:hypothetical protein